MKHKKSFKKMKKSKEAKKTTQGVNLLSRNGNSLIGHCISMGGKTNENTRDQKMKKNKKKMKKSKVPWHIQQYIQYEMRPIRVHSQPFNYYSLFYHLLLCSKVIDSKICSCVSFHSSLPIS